MRALLSLLLVFGMGACTGLLTDPGNGFPCDFSKPPGERDTVCSKGDVCGVDNLCRRFHYEGPQFEGLPTFPFFDDAGSVVHPMLMKGPIDAIVRVSGQENAFIAHSPEGTFWFDREGLLEQQLDASIIYEDLMVLKGVNRMFVIGRDSSGAVFFDGARVRDGVGGPEFSASRLRSLDLQLATAPLAISTAPARLGVLTPRAIGGGLFSAYTNEGPPVDVAFGPLIPGVPRRLVILGQDGLRSRTADGSLLPDGGSELLAAVQVGDKAVLFADPSSSTYAIVRPDGARTVMSVYTAVRSATEFRVDQAWSDCVPCGPLPPLAVTPGTDVLGPFVEVLCPTDGLKRLRGSGTGSSVQCSEEPALLPFEFNEVHRKMRGGNPAAVIDTTAGTQFIAGGESGQVWKGPLLTQSRPVFLDRVPLDVTVFDFPGYSGMFALTSVGLFFRARAPEQARLGNGFRGLRPDITDDMLALVHEGQGWGLITGGHLAQVNIGQGGGASFRFGPRLVDGRANPVTRGLAGEGMAAPDGGLLSMLIAADDSLYFVPTPATSERFGLQGTLGPVLTPEPSTLIRSFALERTSLGTDGISRVRGYLVTARNVYEFKLGGAPLQWTAVPLKLSGAEPVEVWFDNPRGGLGRVGYRDGTVFSLPGGFQLTEPLPSNDAGVPATIIDYENLAGWPVALTSAGLFLARYDTLPTGRLANRFPDGGVNRPMTWREVSLPDGSRPWLPGPGRRSEARPGKLFVLADPQTGSDKAYRRLFHLMLFLPDRVLEVGQHERSNISTVSQ